MNNFGSLQNVMAAESRNAVPMVGMGATEIRRTDWVPYTITRVMAGGRVLKLQQDKAVRKGPKTMGDAQQYDYFRDPNGPEFFVSLRKDGRYHPSPRSSLASAGLRSWSL